MSVESDLLEQVEKRMSSMEKSVIDLSTDILHLKNKLDENNRHISTYIDFLTGLRYGFKILKHIQIAAIWVASVAGASGVIYVLWRYAIIQTILESGVPK